MKNPPNGRHPIILHEYHTHNGSQFSEWKTLIDAIRAFEKNWSSKNTEDKFKALKGFLRFVNCGKLTPWFYAVGEEVLVGDYAIASGLEDDPVYRLGRRFVVYDEKRIPHVKTCMGSRFREDEDAGEGLSEQRRPIRQRLVYFDDGTVVEVDDNGKVQNGAERYEFRPLQDGEQWIADAMERFALMLAGQNQGFQLKFEDGSTFTAKLAPKGKGVPRVEGDYLLRVVYDGGKVKQGTVKDFVPTHEITDVVALVKGSSLYPRVEKVEVLGHTPKKDGKKWSGVFYSRPK